MGIKTLDSFKLGASTGIKTAQGTNSATSVFISGWQNCLRLSVRGLGFKPSSIFVANSTNQRNYAALRPTTLGNSWNTLAVGDSGNDKPIMFSWDSNNDFLTLYDDGFDVIVCANSASPLSTTSMNWKAYE